MLPRQRSANCTFTLSTRLTPKAWVGYRHYGLGWLFMKKFLNSTSSFIDPKWVGNEPLFYERSANNQPKYAQFLSCTLHAWWWPSVVLSKATACSADAIQEVVWGKEDLIAHGLPGICCMERGRCIPLGTGPLTRSLQVARCICEGVASGKLQGKIFLAS